jgi:hypothetical protein
LDSRSDAGGSTLALSCDLLDGDSPNSEASRVSAAHGPLVARKHAVRHRFAIGVADQHRCGGGDTAEPVHGIDGKDEILE